MKKIIGNWYIPVFLLGFLVGGLITVYIIGRPTKETEWSRIHPLEVDWAIARYNLIQKAAGVLYFDDTNKGITIVKPTE